MSFEQDSTCLCCVYLAEKPCPGLEQKQISQTISVYQLQSDKQVIAVLNHVSLLH